MDARAAGIIAELGLEALPREGGFFRRTWTSSEALADGRATGSAIYFLMTGTDFSALHRMRTDELWFFHAGDPVEHVQLDAEHGGARVTLLGSDFKAGEVPQVVVSGGTWQGARVKDGRCGYALVSCVMAPAWDEKEFELGERAALMREFPAAARWIEALTR